MPDKFKVTIGEESHEVDADAIQAPKGFVLMTQATFDATVETRLAQQKRSLAEDAEFAQTILRKHNVPLDDEGKPKIPKPSEFDEQAERERIKAAVLNEVVNPLKSENEKLQAQVSRLLDARKRAEIHQAAHAAGMEDWVLLPVNGATGPTMIENMVAPLLEHDPKHDMFGVVDMRKDDEITFRPATKQGKPWADVSDLFEGFRKNPAYQHLFKNKSPISSDVDAPAGGGGDGKTYTSKDLADGTADLEAIATGKAKVVD